MRKQYVEEVEGARVQENLKNLLRKLGIKSANIFPGLTEQHINDMMKAVQNNYGAPDQIYISPQALSAIKKAFKK